MTARMSAITWEFILRTFKRVDMIARSISDEALAKELLAHDHAKAAALRACEYLSDVLELLRLEAHKAGVDLDPPRSKGNCLQCGKEIRCYHRSAHYCSTACRQRAYRVRKAVAEGRNSPVPKRRRTKPTAKEASIMEFQAQQQAKKEALDFANSMYAIHLKAHLGEEKRSAEPQCDVSSVADDKRNVARAK
jgi:hypothetical protein